MIDITSKLAPQSLSQAESVQELIRPLGDKIRFARRERQLTWKMLAVRSGLRTGTLRRLEEGQRTAAAAVIGRIARALGIDEAELYPGGRPDVFWQVVGAQMRSAVLVPIRIAA